MKNITIGIPRGLLYYKYRHLWTSFFKELGINILISPFTNNEIIESVKNELYDDVCIALKIYIGHVKYLMDKVDYVLISRIDKDESCYYYNSIYDIINNKYNIKILDFNIDEKTTEEEAFIRMGHALKKGRGESLNAYKKAKKMDYKQKKINYLLQQKKLKKEDKKVLIVSNDYIYNDDFIKNNILKFNNISNTQLIYYDIINPDNKNKNCINDFNMINKAIYIIPNFCFKNNHYMVKVGHKLIINLNENNIDKIINNFINDKENNCE